VCACVCACVSACLSARMSACIFACMRVKFCVTLHWSRVVLSFGGVCFLKIVQYLEVDDMDQGVREAASAVHKILDPDA